MSDHVFTICSMLTGLAFLCFIAYHVDVYFVTKRKK